MKKIFVFLLVIALVSTQGLRLCVHLPDASDREAHSGFVHYESDSDPDRDKGKDYRVSYLSQVADLTAQLVGSSAFTIFLILLLLIACSNRNLLDTPYFAQLSTDDCRLRPPLRAPPF